jgi:hypothetical protein
MFWRCGLTATITKQASHLVTSQRRKPGRVEAIRAGYCPFYHFRKAGSGSCPNEVCALLKANSDSMSSPMLLSSEGRW